MCLGGERRSPEGLFEEIISSTGEITGNVGETLNFYVINGCEGEFYFQDTFDSIVDQTDEVVGQLGGVFESLNLNQMAIESKCELELGTLDPTKFTFGDLQNTFEEFADILNDLNEATQCKNLNSIVIIIFHDNMCDSLPNGLVRYFAALVALYIIGMFMIFCRGAFLPSELIGDYESPKDMNDDELIGDYDSPPKDTNDDDDQHRYTADQEDNAKDLVFSENDNEFEMMVKPDDNDTSNANFLAEESKSIQEGSFRGASASTEQGSSQKI